MLYPMSFMVLLTFIVGFIAVRTRFASVKQGHVKARYFKLMQGQDIPENLLQSTRSFNNQFEVPVLFYVVCTLYISLNIESDFALVSAWLFVAFRAVHAYVHLTYNHVLHRMIVFWLGIMCVLALWVNLLLLRA
ncbi:MAPEG family protein [Paraglaciecola aquimarina]|uniref:MAPEG family protein n=1 Tax=Paraglaciecola algarum TaxID=3050085 RepID=A0ABS9DAN6_9ALTE|nr:MAPEG family protein [Paraglaciecola sp. G1-23]MCF2950015.1 MAPEG family protein [Paraglaciecola sp. G1-23]